ncbi:insulinase family protein [Aliidiomarina celeris]|uniref:insulinase family protein n=1 Tax=Aliidiomarina celeris TaxID=2249428 RepID=UPI000DE80176|nr:insulinase family protein [Aliidiomarina celeris]
MTVAKVYPRVHQLFFTGLMLSLLLLTACSPASQPRAIEREPDVYASPYDTRDYREITLENGLRVILVTDRETEKSAAALAVGVGSLQNPDDQQGLAHFLEHMLFLGTEKYPDPDEYSEFMSRHGGSQNAYTDDNVTNYMFEVNNNALPEALDRFADFFKAPLFTPEYVEKEVNAVHSEWSMQRENDGYILHALNNKTLNPEHPITRFRIGNNESLSNKPNSELLASMVEFYQRYYSANLMTATVIGNRSLNELEELARGAFADIPNFNATVPAIDVPAATGEQLQQIIYYQPQAEMRTLMIDFVIPNQSEAFASKPESLVAYLIASEMPGTPAAVLREAGLIEQMGAWGQSNMYSNAGLLRVTITLTEQGYEQRNWVIGLMFRYFDMLRQQGVDEAYVNELRTVLNNEFQFLRGQSAFSYAATLADAMQHYPTQNAIDYRYRLDSYDEAATTRVLNALTVENARIFVIAPHVETDQSMHYFPAQYRIEKLAKSTLVEWQNLSSPIGIRLPAVNRFLPESLHVVEGLIQPEPVELLNSDGMSVAYQRSNRFAEPRAVVLAQYFKPNHEMSWQDQLAAELLLDAFRLSQSGLARESAIAGLGFNLSYNRGLTLLLSGFDDKQQELAQTVMARFAEFEPSAEQIESSRDRMRREIENRDRQRPIQRLWPAFNRILPLNYHTDAEQLEALRDLTKANLMAVRNQLLDNVLLRAFIFGNHTEDSALSIANSLRSFARLDPERTYEEFEPTRSLPGGFPLSYQQDTSVSDSAVLEASFLRDTSLKTQVALRILRELMNTRAFNQLRTEEQLGYAVGVTGINVQEYPGIGLFIQSPVRGPGALTERFQQFKTEFSDYLEALPAERFAQTQDAVIGDLRQPPQNLNEEAGELSQEWSRAEPMYDRRQRQIALVEAMTKEELLAIYQQWLSEENARVRIEIRGSEFQQEPFSNTTGWQTFP